MSRTQYAVIEKNGTITPYDLHGKTWRSSVAFLPEGPADPAVEKRLKEIWHRSVYEFGLRRSEST